jgi:sulfur carrier protein
MPLKLNGKMQEYASGLTVSDLLKELNLGDRRVAVEVNQEIIPKSDFGRFVLSPNDVLEIVSFVGGG